MRPCDVRDVCGQGLPESRNAMEIQNAVVNVDTQDEPTWNEAGLDSHHRGVADVEFANTLATGRNTLEIRKIIRQKRGTLERARWHAGLFECLIRMRKVVFEYLFGRKQASCHLSIHDIDRIMQLKSP